MSSYWPNCSLPLSLTVFPFSSFILWVIIVGLGSSDCTIKCKSLSPSLALPAFLNSNNNNNKFVTF